MSVQRPSGLELTVRCLLNEENTHAHEIQPLVGRLHLRRDFGGMRLRRRDGESHGPRRRPARAGRERPAAADSGAAEHEAPATPPRRVRRPQPAGPERRLRRPHQQRHRRWLCLDRQRRVAGKRRRRSRERRGLRVRRHGDAGLRERGGRSGGAGVRPDQAPGVRVAACHDRTITAAAGTTLVMVDPGVRHQTFEGWGTSLCWWANHVGGWSAANRNAVVDKMIDATNGLGYSVFRYNIGGGDDPTHTHMGQYKNMPGFEPTSGTWNWNADANQRAILQRIVADNANAILEAFSNSPPYWMTKSGCASGNTDGSNNLKDDSYNAFADYLTEVVKHYRDTFGITFRTLEALNEPNATWWTALGGQEGCHFSPSNQQTIIKAIGAALTAKGLSGTTVSASDENSIDDGYNNMKAFDATTLADMSQMNVHTYSGSDACTTARARDQQRQAPLGVGIGAAEPDARR